MAPPGEDRGEQRQQQQRNRDAEGLLDVNAVGQRAKDERSDERRESGGD